MSDTTIGEASAAPTEVEESTCAIQTGDSDREMPCPMCGAAMPDLKGGKASVCPNCGFKDSCCY